MSQPKTPENMCDALRNGFAEIAELVPGRFSDLNDADLIILMTHIADYFRKQGDAWLLRATEPKTK
jgi:hypothetical protein